MRRRILARFAQFLRDEKCDDTPDAIRRFLSSLGTVKPRTREAYFEVLRAFHNYLISQEEIGKSPLDRVMKPEAQQAPVLPYSDDEVRALLTAARRSRDPKRNEALLLFLLDTGCRASEVCGLTVGDLDFDQRCCLVLGKGRKRRPAYFSSQTAKALTLYLRGRGKLPDTASLWVGKQGVALTRYGLLQLMERLGSAAGVQGANVHRWRHTFGISMIRGGTDAIRTKQLLGHTTLSTTLRYVSIANADLQSAHEQASPVDRLLRKR